MKYRNQLDLLGQENWEEIVPKLLKYTEDLVNLRFWRTPNGTLAKGRTYEDVVNESIIDTFKGATAMKNGAKKASTGERFWDPENVDILKFLKGVVDSKISQLVESLEHKSNNYNNKILDGSDFEMTENAINSAKSTSSREEEIIKSEMMHEFNELWEELEDILKSDSTASDVLTCYRILSDEIDGNVSNQQIAAELGIDVVDVRNALKRIRRNAQKVLNNRKQNGK